MAEFVFNNYVIIQILLTTNKNNSNNNYNNYNNNWRRHIANKYNL